MSEIMFKIVFTMKPRTKHYYFVLMIKKMKLRKSSSIFQVRSGAE